MLGMYGMAFGHSPPIPSPPAFSGVEVEGSLHEFSRLVPWQPVVGTALLLLVGIISFWLVRWVNRTDGKYDGSAADQRKLARELGEFRTHVARDYVSKADLFHLFTEPNNQAHASIDNSLRDLNKSVSRLNDSLMAHIIANGKEPAR